MSKETAEWLNQQCLIGFTEKRGFAWHYRESAQGVEPNHYPGPIPIEDVLRRLFNWEAIEMPLWVHTPIVQQQVPNKKAIVASDNFDVLGIFSDGYQPHQYQEWLLDNIASILDDDLGIASAILLRNRGVACVQVEVPDTITTKDGVQFRPNLSAATSFDGSLRTIYKRMVTDIVCDNTKKVGFAEEGQEYKLRHTRSSKLKLGEARDALQIIFDSGREFEAEVDKLCATVVTAAQWNQVLDALVPVPEEEGRSQTIATKKRDVLKTLWTSDARVEPWKNTAWGVAQAFNTWGQHYATVKGSHRVERNFSNMIGGKIEVEDNLVLSVLGSVIDKELVNS